jgi:hypothetical protein
MHNVSFHLTPNNLCSSYSVIKIISLSECSCNDVFCSIGRHDTLAVSSAYKSRVLRSGRTSSRSPRRISRQFSSSPSREGHICDNKSIPNLMMLRRTSGQVKCFGTTTIVGFYCTLRSKNQLHSSPSQRKSMEIPL